jgi:hypothetical protein
MNEQRIDELHFLLRTDVPVPVVSERTGNMYADEDIYDDHYTLRELVQLGLFTYLGHKEKVFFLRPKQSFRMFVIDEILEIKAGEIVRLSLTEAGRTDFVRWLDGLT